MVYFWAINKNLRCPVLARVDLVSFAPVNLLQFNKCFPKNKLVAKCLILLQTWSHVVLLFVTNFKALNVVYFDNLLGAARAQELVKILFLAFFNLSVDFRCFYVIFLFFQSFFLVFGWKITEKYLKLTKMVENGWKRSKKVFWTAFGCAQHSKVGQNTQQL